MRLPIEQIVYGSDLPIMDYPFQLGRVPYAPIGDVEKRKILWDNSARIFGKRLRAGEDDKLPTDCPPGPDPAPA